MIDRTGSQTSLRSPTTFSTRDHLSVHLLQRMTEKTVTITANRPPPFHHGNVRLSCYLLWLSVQLALVRFGVIYTVLFATGDSNLHLQPDLTGHRLHTEIQASRSSSNPFTD